MTLDWNREAEVLAGQALSQAGQTSFPVSPEAVASALGIQIVEAGATEPEGETIWGRGGPTIIRVRGSDPRRRFTLAHELGHVLIRSAGEDPWRRVDREGGTFLEYVCDLVAGAILLPQTWLESVPCEISFPYLWKESRLAGVSLTSLAVRLRRLGHNFAILFSVWNSGKAPLQVHRSIGVPTSIRRQTRIGRFWIERGGTCVWMPTRDLKLNRTFRKLRGTYPGGMTVYFGQHAVETAAQVRLDWTGVTAILNGLAVSRESPYDEWVLAIDSKKYTLTDPFLDEGSTDPRTWFRGNVRVSEAAR